MLVRLSGGHVAVQAPSAKSRIGLPADEQLMDEDKRDPSRVSFTSSATHVVESAGASSQNGNAAILRNGRSRLVYISHCRANYGMPGYPRLCCLPSRNGVWS